ncbi:hypothetical protein EYF80_007984 [Liparis tanakae]|uniref:Uncharacterized protein n=1 Tax=Liparis tanakae TaxID=230148 RepID=A0A4Z2IV84_9TELE|nr:hypothetical protein EYF80_007984 [Liparis tanakae]
MPWEAVLAREGIWLWLRGTLYRASAMSAALFRMISWKAKKRQSWGLHNPPGMLGTQPERRYSTGRGRGHTPSLTSNQPSTKPNPAEQEMKRKLSI